MFLTNFIKHNIIRTQDEWKSYNDNMFRIFHKNIRPTDIDNLLDVGCANGNKTKHIANFFNINMKNTHGVDYNDLYVKECRQSFNVIKIDLETETLPYRENSFDLVICNQVLEHLKNYQKLIVDLIKVTRTKGYIVIGVPNLAHLINRIYLLFGIQPLCIHVNGPHVRGFTHKAFVDLLNSFKQIELVDTAGSTMYPLPYNLAKYLSNHFISFSGYICYLLQKAG